MERLNVLHTSRMQSLLKHSAQVLAGSQWVDAELTTEVTNPLDGSVIASIAVPSQNLIDAVVEAATAAFDVMSRLPLHIRAAALAHVVDRLALDREPLARLISAEGGKPVQWSRGEVDRSISTFRWAAEECRRDGGDVHRLDTAPGMGSRMGIVRRFPIGPNLGISAFNFPLLLAAHKVAPALATGSPIILKPSPQAPFTANVLASYLLETDLPSGAFSSLALDAEGTRDLVLDPRLPVVSFTGSAHVGWILKGLVPKKKVSLELGGNAAVIVHEDADIDLASTRIAFGAFYHAGQSCISVQRILVHRDRKEELAESLSAHIGKLRTGDPTRDETQIGPMINRAALDRVSDWVREALEKGASILAGGVRTDPYFSPTLLSDVTPDMKVWCEEIFGPVATLTTYENFDEAIERVNDSKYGLQAGVFTQQLDLIMEAHRSIEAGGVVVNDVPSFRADHMPYGGVKESGTGREGIRYSMDEITEPKVLVLSHVAL